MIFVLQQLVEPLLDDRLAITACNTDHGDGKLPAMPGCQLLQGNQGVLYKDDIGIRERERILHDKIPDPTLVKFFDELSSVPPGATQGKEQRRIGKDEPPAIQ